MQLIFVDVFHPCPCAPSDHGAVGVAGVYSNFLRYSDDDILLQEVRWCCIEGAISCTLGYHISFCTIISHSVLSYLVL